jgi:hypothetical protein
MQHSAILKDDEAFFCFKMMIWMCSQFGPPVKQRVPKIIKPDLPLHLRCWDENNPTPVFKWAFEEAQFLAEKCGLAHWPIQLAPSRKKANEDMIDIQSVHTLDSDRWQAGINTGYCVDPYGRPIIHYDPGRCSEAGYLAHLLIPRFAKLKLYARRPPQSLTGDEVKSLTRLLVCHMGLGFTLLACTQRQNKMSWSPLALLNIQNSEDVEMQYLFGTVITLSAHKLTAEQMLASYGTLMNASTRKLIRTVLWQAERQTDAMKLLRRLSKPRKAARQTIRSEDPAHSPQRPAQSSAGLA